MKYLLLTLCSGACFLNSCGTDDTFDPATVRSEIVQAEKEFEKMASEKGIAEAFWFYADSGAVIKRQNDTLIIGKDNIRKYYRAPFYEKAQVNWSPDTVHVSADGSMAWTYGNYVWKSTDTANPAEFKGVFHTVWKKQEDGSWKYVWD